jgi:ribosomal protein L29
VPEIDVVPSSLHVVAVTTVTTDHTISQGTERSYSTAKTEGTSTSVANTVTWNEWQEESIATTVPLSGLALEPQFLHPEGPVRIAGVKWDILKFSAAAGFALCVVAKAGGCAIPAAIAGAGVALGDIIVNYKESQQRQTEMEKLQNEIKQLKQEQATCRNNSCKANTGSLANPLSIEYQRPSVGTQDRNAGDRKQAGVTASSQAFVQQFYQLSYPQYPLQTTTNTRGRSWGGAHTTTNTKYEEHTITNGEAFSSGESWSTATAVDSAHAADLWFTYKVRNTGTEYAREIANLAFNIYIGDDPNPAYTYFVGPDLGGDGKFHNFMPGEEHQYTSRRIPLNLDQMRAVDLGGPIRIVVEDFTYGIDELFYQDAVNAGVLIAIEDGTDDGDEAIDTYLIPTWGTETVLDVLARYFPHTTDADGNLIAIWTPEYRSDTPAWCNEPRRVGTALWCKHALSTADWWNVYTSGLGDGSEGFQDTLAAPGSVALFRFNKDSDLDGYSDRSEERLGTNPNDPASHPKPELIAGVHSIRVGNAVTATLSLLNTGLYDAYGVEAVMIAPDDSVSITNNTVGGSGRVRAQKQVIVGSRILLQSPLPPQWTQPGHAVPAVAGYYTGSSDRTYTFTVQCGTPGGCDVGAGSWSLAWNDGAGASGTLNFGAGYASPTFRDVGTLGVKLALYTGKVRNGESFTV